MITTTFETGYREDQRAARRRSRFFLIAAIAMSLTVFAGFLPSFYLRPYFRTTPIPGYLIVHGLVMTAWQLAFVAQTALVSAGRTDLHRRTGPFVAALAVAVVAVGLHATLNQPGYYAAHGVKLPFPLEILVVGNIFGFILFGGLVATAVVRRRDAAWHKRLIYWACVVTVGPALTPSRTLGATIGPYFPRTFPPEVALVWVAWIALLAHDWTTARRFHPATVIGGMLILFVSPALLDWFLLIDGVGAWVKSLE